MDLSNSDMGPKKDSDMGHDHFLYLTGEKGNIKRLRHVTLAFLNIDMRHQDFPIKGPYIYTSGL